MHIFNFHRNPRHTDVKISIYLERGLSWTLLSGNMIQLITDIYSRGTKNGEASI